MRRRVRKSFEQLLLENKQMLLNNKDSIKAIEEKIEKRHISNRKPVME
ncbi:FbpB family small basic protein [Bacillus manliponensis]|nr:FbpB family small basic protein [Bacillus manliponensis]